MFNIRTKQPCLSRPILVAVAVLSLFAPLSARAQDDDTLAARNLTVMNLFREEMQQALSKLKWRGERLSDDTVYAIALSGLSWESAWGKKRMFSLASGDLRKVPALRKRSARETEDLIREVRGLYERRSYRAAAQLATENFSIDEIGCQPELKEVVGDSLLAQGRPEQAFAVFAAPFDPAKSDAEAANLRFREGAFTAAARAGQRASTDADTYRRAAVAFGISLLLEPDAAQPDVNAAAMEYLERLGVDLDRVALGTLQAPDRLPGLPAYAYSAMDILVYRSKPRLLPFFMHLVQSGDLYLRSRAVLGLGALAYTERSSDPSGWERSAVRFSLRAYGLSSGERNLIEGEVQEAIRSGNFRMRAAGVLAMALMGDDKNVPLLQKALKDRAYMILPQERGRGGKRVYFPVRMAAAAGLARFGINVSPGGGELTGRDFDNARRGGQDVSKDRSGLDRDSIAQVFITPIDVATAIPFDKPKAH